MAINSARIVAGPTITREKSYVNCLPLYRAIPVDGTVVYFFNNSISAWEAIIPYTAPEGQLIAVEPESDAVISLYVRRSGAWVSVSINSEAVDSGTGKTWDPLAQFYTPLAS